MGVKPEQRAVCKRRRISETRYLVHRSFPRSKSMSFHSGRRYINLETYKKTGEPKRTPLQSLEHDGLIYGRTDPASWNVKWIRRNPHVRLVLSDRNGKPIVRPRLVSLSSSFT